MVAAEPESVSCKGSMTDQADVNDVINNETTDENTEIEEDVDTGETPVDTPDDESDSDEVVISIGDEVPPASEEEDFHGKPAPEWVKELRKSDREKAKRIRELEQKLNTGAASDKAAEVGPKPTLESCDWDGAVFETKLNEWLDRKSAHEAEQRKKAEAEQAAQAAWQSTLESYGKAKAALKVRDYEDAEAIAQDVLSPVQQGVILNGAENPAMLVYALGKNPKKAKELGSIQDPVKFAFAVAKLETQLKVTPRKTAPVPERVVRGDAPSRGAADPQLAKLEAEADRTGDRSKLIAYKRQQKAKA